MHGWVKFILNVRRALLLVFGIGVCLFGIAAFVAAAGRGLDLEGVIGSAIFLALGVLILSGLRRERSAQAYLDRHPTPPEGLYARGSWSANRLAAILAGIGVLGVVVTLLVALICEWLGLNTPLWTSRLLALMFLFLGFMAAAADLSILSSGYVMCGKNWLKGEWEWAHRRDRPVAYWFYAILFGLLAAWLPVFAVLTLTGMISI